MTDEELALVARSVAELTEIVGLILGALLLSTDVSKEVTDDLHRANEHLLDIHARLQERWP